MSPRLRCASFALALASALLAPTLRARAEDVPLLTAGASGDLDRAALIRAVLARNPSVGAAQAALRAAEARAETAGSFADPTFSYRLAPQSLWDGPRSGHRIEVAQPIAAWGKRSLAHRAARSEAEAASYDLAALRLDLALAASQLYDDAYLAARSLAVNAAHRALVADLHAAALARYEAGESPRQVALAAELEAARLEHREVELQTLQRIAAAQINALLHRPTDAPLPPLPASLEPPAPEARLDGAAGEVRPELRAADARLEARDAAARLARRERIPDVTLMGGYDGMWSEPEMRPMVGLEVTLPLQRARRRAAIAEADALRDAALRERERAQSEVALAVAIARERLAEAHHGLAIVREEMLPAARDQAEAASAALAAGRDDLGSAIEAERAWYETELEAEQAQVSVSRRTAELLRALGRGGEEDLR